MKTISRIVLIFSAILMFSCSAQRQLASRLEGEWLIEEYNILLATGHETKTENAGSIVFYRNGRGQQTFTSAAVRSVATTTGEIRWDNTASLVFIWPAGSHFRKAWIIVNSSRNRQLWRSTDSEGHVQSMSLIRRKE